MSQTPKPPAVPTRPYLLDYFLLLAGFGLSLHLMRLSPLPVEPADAVTHSALRSLVLFLPHLLRVSEGVTLLLPAFLLPQFALGRRQEVASGEWLWGIAWLGTAGLTAVAALRASALQPEWVDAWLPALRWLWYLGFGSAMALVAVLFALVGTVRRRPLPWTHGLGLALAVWPALPLAGLLVLTKR